MNNGSFLIAVAVVALALVIGVRYRRSTRIFVAAGAIGTIGLAVSLGYAGGASPEGLLFFAVMGTLIWSVWATYVVIVRNWRERRGRAE